MSHVSVYEQKIKNKSVLRKHIESIGGSMILEKQKIVLFSTEVEADAVITIPGWRYQIALVGEEMKYDHFGSSPSSMDTLHKVMQGYNHEIIENSLKFNMDITYYSTEVKDGEIILTAEF